MCEFILDVGCLVGYTNDARCAVHGAGLSPEDLDKPQVQDCRSQCFRQ